MFTFPRINKMFTNAEQWELFTKSLQFRDWECLQKVYNSQFSNTKFTKNLQSRSSLIVFGKFTICSQFCCSQKIYWKFTICSKTGAAARSRNLQKIYNLFTFSFTHCFRKIYNLFTICAHSGTQGVHNSFTFWSRKVYKLFTISLKRVAAWENDTMSERGGSFFQFWIFLWLVYATIP